MRDSPRWTTVLFDLDHTLLDSDASHAAAFDASMRTAGIESSDAVAAEFDRINQALWRRVERAEILPGEVKVRRFEQLLTVIGVDADPAAMGAAFAQALTDHGELYQGARELLESLRGRVRLGLVTNGIGSVQRGRLARLDVERHFDAVTISSELGVAKPAPEIFDVVLDDLGVADRTGVVMVGDSLASDIAGASNAGIDSIWFAPHGEASLEPTHTARSIDEIADLVG